MKKYTLMCIGLCAAMAFTSCKSSESAYKKAYEKAKQYDTAAMTQQTEEAPVVAPVQAKPADEARVVDNHDNVSVRQESVSLVSGSGLKAYSVVVGSFGVRANADGLQQRLKDAGYDARLYCPVSTFLIGPEDNFYEYFSNIEAREITYEIDYNRLHSCLKEMSGFSFAPYFLKKHFFYSFDFSDDVVQKNVADIHSDQKWIPIDNPGILKKMTTSSGLTTSANKPTFSFYYSRGVHLPWRLDEKCNRVDDPFDNPCPTTRSCFFVLSEFIRLLKEANIYDNTAILICSDHGGNGLSGSNGKYDLTFMIKSIL